MSKSEISSYRHLYAPYVWWPPFVWSVVLSITSKAYNFQIHKMLNHFKIIFKNFAQNIFSAFYHYEKNDKYRKNLVVFHINRLWLKFYAWKFYFDINFVNTCTLNFTNCLFYSSISRGCLIWDFHSDLILAHWKSASYFDKLMVASVDFRQTHSWNSLPSAPLRGADGSYNSPYYTLPLAGNACSARGAFFAKFLPF